MKVRTCFQTSTAYAEPWDTLKQAAVSMHSHGFSCLPVLLKGDVVGIITECDMVEAVANGDAVAEHHVVDYMSEHPVTVSLDDDSEVAATRMLAVGCRHLPVVDRGKLVGTISAADLLLLAAHTVGESVQAPTFPRHQPLVAAVGLGESQRSGGEPTTGL
jgi:predicted transcriptional regulator